MSLAAGGHLGGQVQRGKKTRSPQPGHMINNLAVFSQQFGSDCTNKECKRNREVKCILISLSATLVVIGRFSDVPVHRVADRGGRGGVEGGPPGPRASPPSP